MKICSKSKCNYTLEKIVENDVKIDIENLKPSREEKRAIIIYRLKNNFPMLIVLFFAIAFILIGVAAIGLEIVLIEKKALNYHLANGIWGGLFSILNGLLKANLIIWKNYSSYIFSELFTPFVAIVSSVGLSILCVYNLREYAKCISISSCTPLNQNLTIAMLVLGLIALHLNFFFAFHFKMGLFGSWKRVRAQSIGFFEAFRELCHLWT